GVMGVAPLGEDPAAAFARLADVAAEVRRDHPDATWVSAGMSGDLEQAIAAGATHVRVGSAVLGPRPVIK
ncbi:alanine racemase, partial [Algoriphagus aestuarii]|nr:alanine racemase [Algoriphagus aestuarii]